MIMMLVVFPMEFKANQILLRLNEQRLIYKKTKNSFQINR